MLSEFVAGTVLTVTEIFGDYGAKMQMPILTFLGYNLLAFELLKFLKDGSLTLVNANWDAVSNVATFLLGFYMGERFTTRQYLGLFLISFGLFLIQ